jgi:hypothetical protein
VPWRDSGPPSLTTSLVALPLLSLHFQFVSINSVQVFMLTDVCVYCSSWPHWCKLAGERLWRRWRG